LPKPAFAYNHTAPNDCPALDAFLEKRRPPKPKMPEPPKRVRDEESLTPTSPPSTQVVVNGWQMEQFPGDDEPRILDVVLAERLGFSKPADIRKLVKRLEEQGKLPGVLRHRHVATSQMPTGGERTYESLAYYLDEKNALRVIRRCETDKADDVMEEVITVYLAYRHGTLAPAAPSVDHPAITAAATEAAAKALGVRLDAATDTIRKETKDAVEGAVAPLRNDLAATKRRIVELESEPRRPEMFQSEMPLGVPMPKAKARKLYNTIAVLADAMVETNLYQKGTICHRSESNKVRKQINKRIRLSAGCKEFSFYALPEGYYKPLFNAISGAEREVAALNGWE